MGSATRRRCRQQENTPVRLFLPIDAGSSKAWSAAVLPSISDICCEVPELRGDNFKIWKERILLRLGCMDINYAIRKDEPHKITDTSTPNEILFAGIRDSIEQHENVRELLKAIDEQFVTSDKALASTLIMKFTSLKLTGIRGVHEHIMEMRDIVAQLKKLEVEMSESFLVHFILNTLPPQYGPFKISYNTHKDKWSINELMIMCVQRKEETSFNLIYKSDCVGNGILYDGLYCGKQTNKSKRGATRSSAILEIIHIDICSLDMDSHGQKYFISFIDDFSRYMYLYILHNKNEVLEAYKVFKAEVEKQCGKQIKIVRSDRGEKYYGRYLEDGQSLGSFAKFLQEHRIFAQYTMSGSPDQNGVVERRNRTLLDMELPGTSEQQVEPHTSLEDIGATLRRSTRTKRSAIPNDYVVYLQECDYNIRVENDPESFSQAMSCKELELWYNDMKDEMSSMKCNNVWDLVELPNGAKVIGCKWVFKTKKDSLGNIERHKAKLVAKGFT
ncbi:Retrovirus-related Pol polyprotein from transposon TNT 1-94 [Vitis vinifera]|uniref:Retrovirus-related Pol polyprotein from transposon TNT 1-94 n=1 Tax=Vitis vinifera TaxID=29760 RepID=A0A438JML6_VITVI|nr:Retrovirus-related Pol polyprotein from transposon TNT 1-94 [Vitis vinifera]